jgi:hypothetical protein
MVLVLGMGSEELDLGLVLGEQRRVNGAELEERVPGERRAGAPGSRVRAGEVELEGEFVLQEEEGGLCGAEVVRGRGGQPGEQVGLARGGGGVTGGAAFGIGGTGEGVVLFEEGGDGLAPGLGWRFEVERFLERELLCVELVGGGVGAAGGCGEAEPLALAGQGGLPPGRGERGAQPVDHVQGVGVFFEERGDRGAADERVGIRSGRNRGLQRFVEGVAELGELGRVGDKTDRCGVALRESRGSEDDG